MFNWASFFLIWLQFAIISETVSLPNDYIQFGGNEEESRQAEYYLSADSGTNIGPTDELKRTQRHFWKNLFKNSLFGDCNKCCNNDNNNYNGGNYDMSNGNYIYNSQQPTLPQLPWSSLPLWRPFKPLFGANSYNYPPTPSYPPPQGYGPNSYNNLTPYTNTPPAPQPYINNPPVPLAYDNTPPAPPPYDNSPKAPPSYDNIPPTPSSYDNSLPAPPAYDNTPQAPPSYGNTPPAPPSYDKTLPAPLPYDNAPQAPPSYGNTPPAPSYNDNAPVPPPAYDNNPPASPSYNSPAPPSYGNTPPAPPSYGNTPPAPPSYNLPAPPPYYNTPPSPPPYYNSPPNPPSYCNNQPTPPPYYNTPPTPSSYCNNPPSSPSYCKNSPPPSSYCNNPPTPPSYDHTSPPAPPSYDNNVKPQPPENYKPDQLGFTTLSDIEPVEPENHRDQSPVFVNEKIPQIVYQPIIYVSPQYQGKAQNQLKQHDNKELESFFNKRDKPVEELAFDDPSKEENIEKNDNAIENLNATVINATSLLTPPIVTTPCSLGPCVEAAAPPYLVPHHQPQQPNSAISTVYNIISPSLLHSLPSHTPISYTDVPYFNEGPLKYSWYPSGSIPLHTMQASAPQLVPLPPAPPVRLSLDDQPYRACPELFAEYERKRNRFWPHYYN